MKFNIPLVMTKAGVAVLAGATAVVSGTGTAWAAHNNAGPATVVANPFQGAPQVNSGGSATKFSFRLPPEAACSGDTANKGFKVFSYLVDATAYPDPGNLAYNSEGPIGNGTAKAYSLFDDGGSPYNSKAAAPTSGFVFNLPPFDHRIFSVDARPNLPLYNEGTLVLPPATYNMGIACGNPDNTTDKYWNTQITFKANAADPNGLVWEIDSGPTPVIPEAPLTVLLPLTAAALGGAAFVVLRRRRSSTTVVA